MSEKAQVTNAATAPAKGALRNALQALQIDRRFALLDLGLLAAAILLVLTDTTVFFFHVIFVLLTVGAFFWNLRAFVARAAVWVTVTTLVLLFTILAGRVPFTEFVEIPMLVVIIALVFGIARHRTRAEDATRKALADVQQRQAEISALLESTRSVLAYPEFETAARSIFEACKQLIGAPAGCVALLSRDREQNEILLLDTGDAVCSADPALPMPLRGLREEVYRTGKAIYENDLSNSRWTEESPAGRPRLDNVLFAPLVVKGITVGLLGLGNKAGGFTANDVRLTLAFAELASVALYNSRTLESLQNSEERFRSVAQTAGAAIVTINSRGEIVFWNEAAKTFFGYRSEEATGKPLTLIMPERFHAAHRDGLERLVAGGKAKILGRTIEMVGLRKDGSEFPVELSLSSWKTRDGVFFTGIINDITEREQAKEALRKAHDELERRVEERTAALALANQALVAEINERRQAEATLRESEERYRRLMELSFEAIVIHHEEKLVYANPQAVKLLGAASAEELLARPIRDFVHPDHWDMVQRRMQQVREEGKGVPLAEQRYIRLDGTVVDVEVVSVPISYQGRPAVQTVIHDISARRRAEAERERERASIARDLHDSLGHSLGYLHLKLDALVESDALPKKPGVLETLMQMRDVASEAYDLVRGMLAALLPSTSTDLTTALLVKARKVSQQGGFKVQFSSKGRPRALSPILQQQLLYLLQEALINVEKHAGARQVEIEVAWQEDALVITLADDGKGFDPHDVPPTGHFGLAIMRERARETRAQLTLNSRPGHGTQVIVRLPLYDSAGPPWPN